MYFHKALVTSLHIIRLYELNVNVYHEVTLYTHSITHLSCVQCT